MDRPSSARAPRRRGESDEGDLDELMIFDQALTQPQINDLIRSLRGNHSDTRDARASSPPGEGPTESALAVPLRDGRRIVVPAA